MTRACIFGCSGLTLTDDERAFFATVKPAGFILFKRNIASADQVKALVADLKDVAGHDRVMILIDQEGGRVRRLRPPHWPDYPPMQALRLCAGDVYEHRELARLSARLMAHDLHALGINVDCAPVVDVPQPGAHDIIGDRAYGEEAQTVAVMGRAACEGFLAGAVLPILKHIPGHGRALADSHHELPVVEADLAALEASDFYPFRVNADMPFAMTAHVVYPALDAKNCATQSKKVIRYIREEIGFDGLIVVDDLGMNALKGSLPSRAEKSLKAGCDLVMLCNGTLEEMRAVADVTPKLKGKAKARFASAFARLTPEPEPLDYAAGHARLQAALARLDVPVGVAVDPTEYVSLKV
jgi:beta-N-acetylhexosaminidase